MAVSALEAAREYIADSAGRGVFAVSPRSIASRLRCSDDESIAILKQLRNEGLGVFKAFVRCPSCHEAIALQATVLIDMVGEARQVAETSCRFCGSEMSHDPSGLEVHLSFFLSAAESKGSTAKSSSEVSESVESTVTLRQIEAANTLNPNNIYVLAEGATMNVYQKAPAEPQTDSVTGDVQAGLTVAVKHETDSERTGDRDGRESLKRVRRNSGLLGKLVGDTEETYTREGNYKENTKATRRSAVAVGLVVVVFIAVIAAIWTLYELMN